MCRAAETLGIKLVDIFGSGGTGSKPTIFGDYLEPADGSIIEWGAGELGSDFLTRQFFCQFNKPYLELGDLDNDGDAEVIFASWTQKGSQKTGKLHILDSLGRRLAEVELPAAYPGDWNGALAAPTLANIDLDADLEVVLLTAHSGAVVYDLPGTGQARILWGTGRGSFLRNGYQEP